VYGKIVNDVIETSRTAFEEDGIDMSALDLLQSVRLFLHFSLASHLSLPSQEISTNRKHRKLKVICNARNMDISGLMDGKIFVTREANFW
jgi:hypothetical protein